MRRTPNRARADITQPFNDGVVVINEVSDAAKPGYRPQKALREKIRLRFAEQRLGIGRIYQSKQAQVEIIRVIRVPAVGEISPQDVAILANKQYQIDTVQRVLEMYPPCVDLALAKIEQEYEVSE